MALFRLFAWRLYVFSSLAWRPFVFCDEKTPCEKTPCEKTIKISFKWRLFALRFLSFCAEISPFCVAGCVFFFFFFFFFFFGGGGGGGVAWRYFVFPHSVFSSRRFFFFFFFFFFLHCFFLCFCWLKDEMAQSNHQSMFQMIQFASKVQ